MSKMEKFTKHLPVIFWGWGLGGLALDAFTHASVEHFVIDAIIILQAQAMYYNEERRNDESEKNLRLAKTVAALSNNSEISVKEKITITKDGCSMCEASDGS